MKKKYLVFPSLLVMLSAFLIMGYVEQTEQIHRKEAVRALAVDAASLIEDKGENAFSEFKQ